MKKIIALVLAIGMVLCLCACGADKNETTGTNTNKNQTATSSVGSVSPKFEVTVTDSDGNVVEGVILQMCKDSCIPARTDSNGVATFNIPVVDGYKLSVVSCPEGYEYTGEETIYIKPESTEYNLEITKK